jgi:hypothetical protein
LATRSLRWEEAGRAAGARVLAVETDRGILLTPYDPDVEAGLAVAAHAAKKFRNALRELGT